MFSYIFKRFFYIFFLYIVIWQGNNFVNSVMLACGNVCIVLQLTPHLCPAQPVHVKCFLRTVYGLNAYEGTKTTNSLHLSERYSAEFKQTIEINEHTWYSFHNIWIFRCMQSHAEHSAVKWESFFSLIMQTEHFNNEPSLWDPHCYYNSCTSALQNTQRMF